MEGSGARQLFRNGGKSDEMLGQLAMSSGVAHLHCGITAAVTCRCTISSSPK
jgi:hypothetical protein